jgi:hypothetical protein
MQRSSWFDMNLGIGKTLYQTSMIFNTRAYMQVDTLVYPYIYVYMYLHNTNLNPS